MAVDDDLYSLKVYREFLCDSKLNFYFIQVIDLINTVEIAVNLEPDIILMDWEMPGVSGTDFIVNLKANQVTKSIPVIMVTSRSSNSDIQTAFDVGAIDYIRKPIEKTEIIARVNTIAEFVKVLKPLRMQNKKTNEDNESKNVKNQISILYVEDSVELRSYVSACLKEQYIVIEAENGRIGLEKAIEFAPDLIISDINMPDMDGWEMCKHIRENSDISHIPIILLTAQQSEESKIKGFKEGADDYLTKPFSHNVLFARIENLIKIRKDLRDQFYNDIFTDYTILCKNTMDLKFLESLNRAIEQNISNEGFNGDLCAELLVTSKSTLYRKLQALTGQSFNNYLRTIRLKNAAKELKNEQTTLTELAYRYGFNSLSYFSRSFLEQFGVSPTQFTKNESQ